MEKPYLYLDWNIFKYLKSDDSKYDSLREAVTNAKQRYLTPYSEAHIYDLLTNFDDSKLNYVMSDLETITRFTQNMLVGEALESTDFILRTNEPKVIFDHIRKLKDEHVLEFNISDMSKFDPNGVVKIDMEKMSKDNPLYNMLEKTNGVYIPEVAALYQVGQFEQLFEDKDPYRGIRNAVMKVREEIRNNKTLTITPKIKEYLENADKFLALLEVNDIDVLKSEFIAALNGHLALSDKSIATLSTRDKIGNAYALLDFHPLFQEKIKNNRASNMTRDSVHAYYAMNSKYFVSFDNATVKKTNFIYDVFEINSKALHMNDFIIKFR